MGVSRVFNQLFKCYQGEQAVSASAGPDGLSCEPCWLPQPLHAAAGAYWCYTEPTASGESRRQLVVTFFSLFSVYSGWQVGPKQGANHGNIICGATVDFDQL